jgi:hypothetical protein
MSSAKREDVFGLTGFSENKFKICVPRLFHSFFNQSADSGGDSGPEM